VKAPKSIEVDDDFVLTRWNVKALKGTIVVFDFARVISINVNRGIFRLHLDSQAGIRISVIDRIRIVRGVSELGLCCGRKSNRNQREDPEHHSN